MVETSVFGNEFVAMKEGMDAMRGLRYKLRMMGIPISSPSYIYEENMLVVCNISRPESVFGRKATQFAIMQSMNQLQRESPWLDIYPAKRMLQI